MEILTVHYIYHQQLLFLRGGQKIDFFAPHGAIKSTLWPASRTNLFWNYQIFDYYFLV